MLMMTFDIFFLRKKGHGKMKSSKKLKKVYVLTEEKEVLLTTSSQEIQALMTDLKFKMATNQYWLVRMINGDFTPYNKGGQELRFKTDEYENVAFVKYSPKGNVITFDTFYGEDASVNSSEILKDLLKSKELLKDNTFN